MIRWRIWVIIGLAMVVGASAGCGDQLGLADRAAALVMSVTPSSSTTFRWTFDFPNPAVTISSITNLTSANQFYQASTTATSLDAALAKVQTQLSRRLYLGQLEAVVVSPQMRATALATFINQYNADGLLPKTAYLVAEPSKAAQAPPTTAQETVPSVYFTRYFSCSTCQPVALQQRIWQVWDALDTPGVSAVIPLGTLTKGFSRLLVYPQRDVPTTLSREATRGWAFLTNHVNHETVTIRTSTGLDALTNIRAHASTRMRLHAGQLDVWVNIHDQGIANSGPALNASATARMRQAISRKIVALSLTAISQADKTETDPFGWDRTYLFHHPAAQITNRAWLGRIWPLHVHVTVTTEILSHGVSE